MKQVGFSLVELMVTIAVGAVVLTMAVPSFQTTLANNRLLTFSNDLVVGMNFTRSEAIKRSNYVSICASTNQQFCTGTDWSKGWLIFTDNGTPGQVDGGDVILRSYANTNSDVNLNLGGATFMRYGGAGFLASETPKMRDWMTVLVEAVLPGGTAEAAGNVSISSVIPVALSTQGQSFTVCSQGNRAKKGRTITISASGRISTIKTACP